MEKTIEIDCAAGTARPDTYIEGVIEGTGLALKNPKDKFFGNWVWDYSEVTDEEWLRIQPTIRDRITTLYAQGAIRYGSW